MDKPRISKVLDQYAIQTGQHWCCDYAGFCARGATPRAAYDSLMDHFRGMRQLRAGWLSGGLLSKQPRIKG